MRFKLNELYRQHYGDSQEADAVIDDIIARIHVFAQGYTILEPPHKASDYTDNPDAEYLWETIVNYNSYILDPYPDFIMQKFADIINSLAKEKDKKVYDSQATKCAYDWINWCYDHIIKDDINSRSNGGRSEHNQKLIDSYVEKVFENEDQL